MIQALRRPAIARLWFGQATSTIGDEIYRVGLTWLAVDLIGADAGYMNAAGAGALMLFSLVGGHWADRWKPVTTMVFTDMVRAGIVLVPVVWSFFSPLSIGVLWFLTLTLASAAAFFEPAMQEMLPRLARDRELLRSTNGLMATTFRMARMVGPTIVGLLSSVIPMIHFFTVDAITYIVSAFSINSIPALDPEAVKEENRPHRHTSILRTIVSGYEAVRERTGIMTLMLVRAMNGGCWGIIMGLGIALYVRDLTVTEDARQFGYVMGSYGFGNFFGSLFFGNIRRMRSWIMIWGGYVWLGAMFVGVGLAPSIGWMMFASALAGFAGPMNDLGFIDTIQTRFHVHELPRVVRFRLTLDTGFGLVAMLLAPSMIRMFGVRDVIMGCGTVYFLSGVIGLLAKEPTEPAA